MRKDGYIFPIICFIDGLQVMLIVPALLQVLFFEKHPEMVMGTSLQFQFGLLLALPFFCKTLLLPILRGIAHKTGIQTVLIATIVFFIFGNFLTGFSFATKNLFLLFVARGCTGVGITAFPLMLLASSLHIFDRRLSLRIQGYGITLGPLIGGFGILPPFGIEIPFYFATILGLFSLSYFLFKPFRPKRTYERFRFTPLWSDFRNEDMLTLSLAFFCAHVAWNLYFYDVPLFAFSAYSFSFIPLIFLMTLFCLGLQIGLGIFSMWIRTLGRKGVAIGAYILIGLFMVLETAPKTSYLFWFLAIPSGLAAGIAFTNSMGMFAALAEKKQVNDGELIAYTVQNTATTIGMVLVAIFASLKSILPLVSSFLFLAFGISLFLLGRFSKTDKEDVF